MAGGGPEPAAPHDDAPHDVAKDADLLRRLRATLEFADRTVAAADPEHSLWSVDLGHVTGFDKLMLEASVLALVTSRTSCVDDLTVRLMTSVAVHCDRERLCQEIRRHPPHLATFGTVLIVLDFFGLATEEEREVIRSAADSPFLQSAERTPFRLLDRNWVLRLARQKPTGDPEALSLTTAAHPTHPIYLSREDVYAITHAVMYTTDFGKHRAPSALRKKQLWQSIDASLAWCLAAHDFDLTVELLLTQLLLRGELSEYGAVAWEMVRRTWDQLGFVPGPSLSAREFEAVEVETERRQYAHFHMYHTIFVSGLLVDTFLALGVGSAAPAGDQVSEPSAAAHPDVASLVERWSGTAARAVLDRMAYDGAAIQAAKSFDLTRLKDILDHQNGASASFTALVARQFLDAQSPSFSADRGKPIDQGRPETKQDWTDG